MNRIRWVVRQIQFLVWRVKNRFFPPTPWDGHHHPALLGIKPWKGDVSGDYAVDFLGVRTDPNVRSFFKPSPEGFLKTEYPVPDQTYFEYIAPLESIAGAPGPEYTIVELGAGYGYWLVNTAKALTSRPDRSPRLVGVEMEATRFGWMGEHFSSNDLDPEAHCLLQAAVSDHTGKVSYQAEEQEGVDYGLSLGRASSSGRAVEVALHAAWSAPGVLWPDRHAAYGCPG
jgi:hypothetical protein